MKDIGGCPFPETEEDASYWKPIQVRRMLHRQCMVVARTRIEGSWKAYCFPVPGQNHDDEEYLWETEGAPVPEATARTLFRQFEGVSYDK